MNTGQIVRAMRKKRGLTVHQLAKKASLSATSIYLIEANRVSPKMDTMLSIIRVLEYEMVFNPKYKGGYKNER